MDDIAPPPGKSLPLWISKPLRWLLKGLGVLACGLMITWAAMAIYWSNLPWYWARTFLAASFVIFSIWALWITRRPHMRKAFAAAFLAVVIWFICIPPSHDRPWREEVAVLPRTIITGDRVRITGVRNFYYRSRFDFDVHYEEREFSLQHVKSLDLFISYWKIGPVAHTFVSFLFDDGTPPLCVSIETRPEVGEGFAPIRSMFKQFELIYLVGDEHDFVGSRATHRNEEVFLYHITVPPAAARRLLEIYLERINELADRPEWYHLLSNSCTINIFRYATAAGREGAARFDIRRLLNGWVDQYLYDAGLIDNSLPFEQLRERARITDVTRAAENDPNFSQRIRAGIP